MSRRVGNRSPVGDDRSGVRSTSPHTSLRRLLPPLVLVALVALAGCGSDGGGGDDLSEAAQRGRDIANSNGCASCHGNDGQGSVGPPWVGLAGSQVTLADGSVVVADDAYLERAIVDPSAEIVDGFLLQMPQNSLSDEQVDDIVTYIKELAGGEEAGG
jgi:mono/diheme cytochrome c family protein